MVVFVDDILIFSKSEEEHALHIREVALKVNFLNVTFGGRKCDS